MVQKAGLRRAEPMASDPGARSRKQCLGAEGQVVRVASRRSLAFNINILVFASSERQFKIKKTAVSTVQSTRFRASSRAPALRLQGKGVARAH